MEGSADGSLLDICDVSKVFSIRQGLSVTHLAAVDKARLRLQSARPEVCAIAGESGSGKTTLASMILGLQQPTSGIIRFKGRDTTKLTGRERRQWFMREVQAVFQDPFATFSPLKRIDSYLYETALNYKVVDRAHVDRHIDEALSAVGLSLREVKGRYPNELSGGQVQRVSIARALITNPSLLVADEPVSMLDASLRMSIVNLFLELRNRKGVSVVYITHDLSTAYYVADSIAIMLRGWIVEVGPVEHVLGNPLHPYTQTLKQSVPEADPAKRWREEISLATMEWEEFRRRGCKFAGRCPSALGRCRREEPGSYTVAGRKVRCFLYEGDGRSEA